MFLFNKSSEKINFTINALLLDHYITNKRLIAFSIEIGNGIEFTWRVEVNVLYKMNDRLKFESWWLWFIHRTWKPKKYVTSVNNNYTQKFKIN